MHQSPYDILESNPFTTLNMTVTNTDNAVSVADKRYKRARKWLRQRIQKVVPRQAPSHTTEDTHIQRKASLKRPSTAPASGTASRLDDAAFIAGAPFDTNQASSHPPVPPLVHPVRPDSSVVRDVNAWLETSTDTLSRPLMSGIPYWREAAVIGLKDSAVAQYAVPVSVASGAVRPATAASQQTTYFRRPAIKMQVGLPSILRTKSPHPMNRNRTNRDSASIPHSTISYQDVQDDAAGMRITLSESSPTPHVPPSSRQIPTRDGVSFVDQLSREYSPSWHNTSTSVSFGSAPSDSHRHANKLFVHSARGTDHVRPSTAAADIAREGSMGALSDVPTYSTGPPPPSYRSRPESTMTTSSFGCIDGMNMAQRQISQQRAAVQRGMRCRLKRLARNFAV